MVEHFPNHKLTAIFYADVAGYSRLTSQNEMGTHKRVTETLDFASEAIKEGRGTVLLYAGDAAHNSPGSDGVSGLVDSS
jgi:class 3 adenylate cyclase